MINDVLDTITAELYNEFGDGYTLYVEKIPQKVKTPCFVLNIIDCNIRSRNRFQYEVSLPLVIQFFPKENTNVTKSNFDVAERVHEAIEYIRVGKVLLRSESLRIEDNNNIIQIFVTYKFTTIKEREATELMESIEQLKFEME